MNQEKYWRPHTYVYCICAQLDAYQGLYLFAGFTLERPSVFCLLSRNFRQGLICLFGSSAPPATLRRELVLALFGAALYVLLSALPMVSREPDIRAALYVFIPTFCSAVGSCLFRFVVRDSVTSFAEVSPCTELCLKFFAIVSSRASSVHLRPCSPRTFGSASYRRGLCGFAASLSRTTIS